MLKKLEGYIWCNGKRKVISNTETAALPEDHRTCKDQGHQDVYLDYAECEAWSGWTEEDLFPGYGSTPDDEEIEIRCQLIKDHGVDVMHYWESKEHNVKLSWSGWEHSHGR